MWALGPAILVEELSEQIAEVTVCAIKRTSENSRSSLCIEGPLDKFLSSNLSCLHKTNDQTVQNAPKRRQ